VDFPTAQLLGFPQHLLGRVSPQETPATHVRKPFKQWPPTAKLSIKNRFSILLSFVRQSMDASWDLSADQQSGIALMDQLHWERRNS
jgi:hypothetical protein